MAFVAKNASPVPPEIEYLPQTLASAIEGGLSLFNAAPGSVLTGQIAAALRHRGTPTLWLRLGSEDADPGMLLGSLMNAAAATAPRVSEVILKQMLKAPGPVNGWAPLYSRLAEELGSALPRPSALVIEHLQNLPSGSQALELFGSHFLPLLPEEIACILTSHHPIQPGILPLSTVVRQTRDLRIDEQSALAQSRIFRLSLPDRDILQLHALSDGRPGLMLNLLDLASTLDLTLLQRIIDQARSVTDLLARLARAWVTGINADESDSALLATRLGYLHPSLGRLEGSPAWMQALEDGWTRVHCAWDLSLRLALKTRSPSRPALLRSADRLAALGSVEQAVPLYLDVGETGRAAEVLAGSVVEMFDLGQWQTLGHWLERIPEAELSNFPWLMYARGELETHRRDTRRAGRTFSLASRLFREQKDSRGICRSLLTESALAFWQNNHPLALDLALNAQAEARAAGLEREQADAAWQIGCLYAADELYAASLQQFQEVESLSLVMQDAPLADLCNRAAALVKLAQVLQQQGSAYRQALAAAEQSRRDALAGLQSMLSSPAGNLDEFLSDRGWFQTPMNIKAHPLSAPMPEATGLPGLWQSLLGMLGLSAPAAAPVSVPATGMTAANADLLFTRAEMEILPQAGPAALLRADKLPEPPPVITAEKTLLVHMLGTFQARINDQPVTGWSGGRGRAIFQYLVAHHHRPRTREALMDVFWQDATPESARNNLNVALHNLRNTLRTLSTDPVVIFEDGSYRLNPEFSLWLDVDEFERLAAAAQRADQAGESAAAVDACESALQLYRDDFLAEYPFEEWAVLPRERLKIMFMDILDRLSRIYLKESEYTACARLCQMMLERDRCWEDAHTRLMRCYARQGNYDLAVRQYQACQDALRDELNIEPSETTSQLYLKIRRRESI